MTSTSATYLSHSQQLIFPASLLLPLLHADTRPSLITTSNVITPVVAAPEHECTSGVGAAVHSAPGAAVGSHVLDSNEPLRFLPGVSIHVCESDVSSQEDVDAWQLDVGDIRLFRVAQLAATLRMVLY
jgi:hypothetical protein